MMKAWNKATMMALNSLLVVKMYIMIDTTWENRLWNQRTRLAWGFLRENMGPGGADKNSGAHEGGNTSLRISYITLRTIKALGYSRADVVVFR